MELRGGIVEGASIATTTERARAGVVEGSDVSTMNVHATPVRVH
jgi:hypothetical protein